MIIPFKPEFLREHFNLENIDPIFIDEGGERWWYVYDFVGFLVELARSILSSEKFAVIERLFQSFQKRYYNWPCSEVERAKLLIHFLTDAESFGDLLIVALTSNKMFKEAYRG